METTDATLVADAREGDAAAFAALAQRHLAGMRATAIALLGYTDDADDAVQDALLTALRQITGLRDPEAAGPWLKAIVRNNCRMRLRSVRRATPVADPEPLLPAGGPRPDEALDRAAERDWVWHALGTLSEPVREAMLLRYFTDYSSYQRIADVCGVPVGTVRSRLRDGRRALTATLRATAESYPDARVSVSARAEAEATLAAGSRGDHADLFGGRFRNAVLTLEGRPIGGARALAGMMDYTYGAGVQVRLREAVAGAGTMVWETEFVNPPDDPEHCPPGMVWLHALHEGRVRTLKMAYARAA
ncbi:RNA polymerase sigma factor [Catenuloplanes japonicus]|uniref:RNA polymerase sigma factor n=1 Tax=Catenuloplanes japonicus TaxID=33876 RepID=UPI000526DA26|nr:sigma-70 family RNA polymerase sigma factor [Catenuloplanes japonicus]